jgi:hypothetical protein
VVYTARRQGQVPVASSANRNLRHSSFLFLIAIAAILVFACVLRTIQYRAGTSLWFDELALALNIQKHSLADLVSRPLDELQVAPAGFLAVVKLASILFGVNEFTLRFFPWISALLAIFLFWRVSSRVLTGGGLLTALFLFATSPALIWYGADLKQYSSDVAATLLLVLLALRFVERPEDLDSAFAAIILGGLAMFFSHPAVPTAALLGVIILVRHFSAKQPRPPLGPLLWLGGLWAACAAAASFLALKQLDPQTHAYMHRFWQNDFAPAPWKSVPGLLWIPKHLIDALGFLLVFIAQDLRVGHIFVFVCASLACVGLFVLFRRVPWYAALIIAPAAAAVLAAAARVLPFGGRVALHAGWPLLVAAMAGMEAVRQSVRGNARLLASLVVVAIACTPAAMILLAVGPPPFHHQESRPVLEALARRWKPGDRLYVYPGAKYAAEFYGRRLGLNDFVVAECHREDPRAYFREIDQFRGQARVWFFYTHSALGYREPEVIRSYFSAIGTERDHIPDPYGLKGQSEAAAYLYDLSDPQRLASATWSTHKFPEPTTGAARILCDGTRIGAK